MFRSAAGICSATLIADSPWDHCLSRLGFPLVQELEQSFRRERTRVLEFAVLLADDQLAVAFEHCQGGYALVERYLKFFGQVAILLPVRPNIHMNYFIARHSRREIGPMKRQIQHVAVITRVRAKNQQDALTFSRGLFF